MLKISIGRDSADFAEDVGIQIKMLNPLLSESGFSEGYSYSFNILNSPKNQAILRKYKGSTIPISISSHSLPFIQGVGKIYKNQSSITVEIRNEGLEKKAEWEDTSLTSFEYPVIPIADESDSPTVKINKWATHMNEVRVNYTPNGLMYRFPMIVDRTSRYTDPPGNNNYHFEWGMAANLFLMGGEFVNISEPYYADQSVWRNSVAPCPLIKYLFEKAISDTDVTIENNDLESIIEYAQLFYYPGMHMDLVETDPANSANVYNVHGTEIDLKLFILEKPVIDLFNMLRQMFGCFFFLNNNRISIRLYQNFINKKPVDMSKYCAPSFESAPKNTKIIFKFPVDVKRGKFDFTLWRNNYLNTTSVNAKNFKYKWDPFTIGTADKKMEVEFMYTPMPSHFNFIYGITAIPEDILVVASYFQSNTEFSSSVYNELDWKPVDKWNVGLWRGQYPVWDWQTNRFFDTPVCNNDLLSYPNDVRKFLETSGYITWYTPAQNMQYVLGSMSLHPQDEKSHFKLLLEDYWRLIANHDEINEILYLPPHKIYEIIQWKEPNHIIKQRNLSFIGTVKEVSFTLYKNGVSPTVVTYLARTKESGTTFNGDFNDDFEIE